MRNYNNDLITIISVRKSKMSLSGKAKSNLIFRQSNDSNSMVQYSLLLCNMPLLCTYKTCDLGEDQDGFATWMVARFSSTVNRTLRSLQRDHA